MLRTRVSILRPGPPPSVGVWFSTPESTVLPEHEHAVAEANVLIAGWVEYSVAGRTLRATRGDCLWFPPHTSHRLTNLHPETALWVIELDEHQIGDAPFVEALEDGYRARLSHLLRRLWLRPGADVARVTEERLRETLSASSLNQRATPNEGDVELHPGVLRAKRICETLGPAELDVPGVARRAGVSASRLAHLFQEQVGLTPLQYRNFCRVQHFIRTWRTGEPSLVRAALEAGFGSYPQFHRVFRQVCGSAPRDHLDWLGAL